MSATLAQMSLCFKRTLLLKIAGVCVMIVGIFLGITIGGILFLCPCYGSIYIGVLYLRKEEKLHTQVQLHIFSTY